MNFLAHLYLSGESETLMIGNFIGDFVKGNRYEDYSADIQKGILLHREIDSYTDGHDVVLKSKERLRPGYHHYAPVIVDVFYDHFLSSLWLNYHPQPLKTFTSSFYTLTEAYKNIIPDRAWRMLRHMKLDDWLYQYQFVDGINRALTGMSHRTTFVSRMEEAAADLQRHYPVFQEEFIAFFPDLQNHVKQYLQTL